MPTKKATTKKGTKGSRARSRRNPEGISRVRGEVGEVKSRQNGNGGAKERAVPRQRNPAPTSEERIYANRDKRLTD